MMMELSIIVPTKDRGQILDRCLQAAVTATQDITCEIIVVNDSKTSVPVISSDYERVVLVTNPKSGVASARNFGASCSKFEWLLFMDDDFIINGECINFTLQYMAKDPKKVNLFNWTYPPNIYESLLRKQFGRYLVAHGFDSVQGWLGKEWVPDSQIFELKDGASYFLPISKTLFNEIGGYNETFPHAGAEDYDFIQRAKSKGVRFFLNKEGLLFHDESDRLTLTPWLARKRRNGETLRVAVELGYTELALKYGFLRGMIFAVLSSVKFALFPALKSIPNEKKFDWIYFRVVNMLLAISLYEGYQRRR